MEVLHKYGEYMMSHQEQADGQMRASDNWKRGIPRQAYIESMFRHFLEVLELHELERRLLATGKVTQELMYDNIGHQCRVDEALYALLFNVMGYAHEREMDR